MRRPQSNCVPLLAGVAAALLVQLPFGSAIPASAAEAATAVATSHYYVMPKGDHLVAKKIRKTRATPLGFAISASELARIKRQRGAPATSDAAPEAPRAGRLAPAIVKTCTTNSADVFTPSDIHGAVSPTNYVVTTNDAVGVYRRIGCSTLSRVSLEDFFRGGFHIPTSQGIFDPRALYDFTNQRFFITAESTDDLNFDQFQYFAVSTDSTASAWHLYRIVLSEGSNVFCKLRRTGFWDYPDAGQNINRWFIAANDFPDGEPEEGTEDVGRLQPKSAILTFDKAPTLSGGDIHVKCFNKLQFNTAPPIVLDGSTTSIFLSPGGNGFGNSIKRYALDSSGGNASSDTLTTTTSIKVRAWSAAPNAPQPNGQTLDTLEGRFQSASIQDGTSLWNVHTINVGGFARWRLYKFSTTGTSPLFTVTPSSLGHPVDYLFNPSVTTRSDSSGDPAWVTFSRTIPSFGNPDGFAAMLIAKGPNSAKGGWASTLISKSLDQYEETGFIGGSTPCNSSAIGTCRWGDYSATQIDPGNSNHAIGFNQLIIGITSKNWTTKGSEVQ
jgi:hypothetical protein